MLAVKFTIVDKKSNVKKTEIKKILKQPTC